MREIFIENVSNLAKPVFSWLSSRPIIRGITKLRPPAKTPVSVLVCIYLSVLICTARMILKYKPDPVRPQLTILQQLRLASRIKPQLLPQATASQQAWPLPATPQPCQPLCCPDALGHLPIWDLCTCCPLSGEGCLPPLNPACSEAASSL